MTKDVALMFPGSGSQYVGMARWLYERYPQVRTLFDEASQITERDMAALCLSGTLVQLAEPTAMALAIYTTSVAHFVAWQQFLAQTGVHVNLRYMLGHSLGEYAALTCSGALSFSQALALVAMRSRLASEIAREMDASTTIIKQGNQALVAAACEVAERETRQQVGIACFNSPQQFMLSGQNSAIIAAEQYLLEANTTFRKCIQGRYKQSVLLPAMLQGRIRLHTFGISEEIKRDRREIRDKQTPSY